MLPNGSSRAGVSRAFVFQNGAPRFLDPLPGGSSSIAFDVSEDLIVVGQSDDGVRLRRPVRWVNGVAEDLGLSDDAAPFAISPDGRWILVNRAPDVFSRSIDVWHDGAVTTLPGGTGCSGVDINSRGDVVAGCYSNVFIAYPIELVVR